MQLPSPTTQDGDLIGVVFHVVLDVIYLKVIRAIDDDFVL